MHIQALPLIASLWLTAAPGAQEASTTNRYNVLFIAIDDLRPELGCYGVRAAQSPHLDRLASQGVIFNRHYTQVPTCGASRYAMLTGRSPRNSGVRRGNAGLYSGRAALEPKAQPGAQTMPELFRRSGYHTVCIGKISHTPDGRVFAYNGKGDGRPELPGARDGLATPFGSWKRGWGTFFAYADGKHREDRQGHRDLMEFVAEKDDDLPDGMMASAAVAELERIKGLGKPFFMGLGFFKPHLPFVATKPDWEAFTGKEISLPPQAKIDSPYFHKSGEFYGYNAPYKKSRPLSAEAQRRARRAYYACVRYVDRQVGRVLKALDALGLADNTIVIVWGDHGWHLGEQQLWGKHSPFERANRSVLIVRAPGKAIAGMRTDALVETTDVFPTLVDLCRPKFTKTRFPLDGKSLSSVLSGEAKSVREAATSYWGTATSVRTATHRLVVGRRKKQPHVALYELSGDPDSVTDIAAAHPEIVQRMRKLIRN